MWPNPQFSADLVKFTEEILNGKLHSLCSSRNIHWGVPIKWSCRLIAYNLPQNKLPKTYFSQSLSKLEERRLYISSFVDTSNRHIILKQNSWISVESANNWISIEMTVSQKMTHCYLKGGFWVDNWR